MAMRAVIVRVAVAMRAVIVRVAVAVRAVVVRVAVAMRSLVVMMPVVVVVVVVRRGRVRRARAHDWRRRDRQQGGRVRVRRRTGWACKRCHR